MKKTLNLFCGNEYNVLNKFFNAVCVIICFPAIVVAKNHKNILYFFMATAPLWPMPSYLTIHGIPPTAIIVAILSFSLLANMMLGFESTDYTLKINRISIFLFLFLVILLSDFYWLLIGDSQTELTFFSGRVVSFAIIAIVFLSIDNDHEFISLLKIVMFSICILALIAMLSSFFGFGELRNARSFGGLQMPFAKSVGVPMSDGEFGIIMTFAIPFMLSDLLGKTRIYQGKSIPLLILATTLFATIFISQSRSGWLALAICLALFITLTYNKNAIILLLIYPILLLLVAINSLNVVSVLMGTGTYYENIIFRFRQWGIAFSSIEKNWLTGVGHNFFQDNISAQGEVLHNNFLYNLVSNGLICFIAYLSIIILLIFFLLKKSAQTPLNICAICALAGAITELTFYQGFFAEIFSIELAMCLYLTTRVQHITGQAPTGETPTGEAPGSRESFAVARP